MKTILRLLLNDLKRDWKRPWAMLLLAMMPLALSVLIASVFGGRGGSGPMSTVHVAILDQDKDLLTGLLRSLPTQGDAAKNLRLHFVENREEGFRLVEKSQVSALVVLPTKMTENLLKGQTNSIELYENPAQQVLPKVVRQGVSLLALGLSATAETLGEPLRDIRDMIRSNGFPASASVGGVASTSVEKLGHLRSYVFPPLVKFETVPAADFQPLSTNPPPAGSHKVAQASSPASSGSVLQPELVAAARDAAMSDILLFLLPGAMYFWVLFIGQWPLQEVLQEKETRVLPRILSCPVTPVQYGLAKLLRCFVLCGLAVILLLVVSVLLFGMKWGNPLKLAAVVAAWAGSMTGLLALIFGLCRTKEQSNVLSPLVLLVLAMLGGSMFPYDILPAFLQMIGLYTPNRWAVLGLTAVARAKPLAEVVWPLVGLVAMGALGCGLGLFLFTRQLAAERRK